MDGPFPHLHGIVRYSGKEIVIIFGFVLAVFSRTQVDQLPNFLQMENVTKHTIADIHVLCVAKYLMMSEEIFQDPIS